MNILALIEKSDTLVENAIVLNNINLSLNFASGFIIIIIFLMSINFILKSE